jgi:outer membrane protein
MTLRSKTAVAAAVAIALFTWGAAAHAQGKNDLLSIFQDALKYDSTYSAARFAWQAAQEKVPQARSRLLPQVSAGYGYNYIDTNSKFTPEGAPTTERSSSYGSWGPSLNLTLALYRPQSWDDLNSAQLSITSADAVLAQAKQDLVLRVTQAYFDVLTAQDALLAIEASKKATSEQLAQARREFEVGTKTIVDTHEAQARYDQIAAQEQVAIGDLIVKRNALRQIVGRDVAELLPLREAPQLMPPQPTDIDAWTQRAVDSNPNVVSARAAAQIAEVTTARNRHGHYPTLDLVGKAEQGRSGAPLSAQSPTGGTVSVPGDTRSRSASIGVQLTIPLYSGGLVQSQVRESLALEERARQDLESARRAAAQGARQAFTVTNYGLSQVRALESAEVSAKSQLDSTRVGYQVGVRINLDVLNAQTQLFNTQRDLKKARYDFLLNGMRLKSSAGMLSEDDVSGVNALLAR